MDHYCPICKSLLQTNGTQYSIDQLLELWKPIIFTSQTIEEHRAQSQNTRMYSCPNCELDIFLPIIIGTPQFYMEAYSLESSQITPNTFTYSDDKWEFEEAMEDLKGCQSILEIGCGNGSFLDKIKPNFPIVIGVEFNEKAILNARKKGLCIFGLKEENFLKRASIDVVLSFHVLEHVENPIKFIHRLCELMKPDGKICISVPNQDGPIKYIDPCITNMPPHHATRWRLKTFQHLANQTGLTIKRVSYEPLLLSNSSYYSYYWVNHTFQGKNIWALSLKKGLFIVMQSFFKIFQRLGIQYFSLLRGQSIYVVLEKRKD